MKKKYFGNTNHEMILDPFDDGSIFIQKAGADSDLGVTITETVIMDRMFDIFLMILEDSLIVLFVCCSCCC
jgi:hypothetical protein